MRPEFVSRILGMSKTSSDKALLQDPFYAGGSLAGLAAGGLMADGGIANLRNNDVFISHGTAKALGQGHTAPAKSIKAIIEELKNSPDAPRFMKNLRIHDLAFGDDGRTFKDPNIDKSRRYLTGFDTGWGVLDLERNPEYFFTGSKGPSNYRDPQVLKNTLRKVIFAPDGRSGVTGYQATGDAQRVGGLRDHWMMGYGDFDPIAAQTMADGRYQRIHSYHPLVDARRYDEQGNKIIGDKFSRERYARELSEYLNSHGANISPEDLKNKKIITVSGASRGDSVGVRARMVQEFLESQGLQDRYQVVGLAGKNLARENAIANVGRDNKIPLGGFASNSRAFQELANNSDLHFMGMGGATPFEMMSHGGAPIVTAGDEQVFRASGENPSRWQDAELDVNAGYHARERQLLEQAKEQARLLPEGHPGRAVLSSEPLDSRAWMNVTLDENDIPIRRGLDGIRELLDSNRVEEIWSHSFEDMLKNILNDKDYMDKKRWQERAINARRSLKDSRSSMKNVIKKHIVDSRNVARLRGAAGLLGATAATAPALYGVMDLLRR